MNTIKTVLRREENLAPDTETVLAAIRAEIAHRPVRRRRRLIAVGSGAAVVIAAAALTTGLRLADPDGVAAGQQPAGATALPTFQAGDAVPAGLSPAPPAPSRSPFSPRYVPTGWTYLYSQPSFTSYAGPNDSRTGVETFTGRLVFSLDADYAPGKFTLRADGRPARIVTDGNGRPQAVQVELTQNGAAVLNVQLFGTHLTLSTDALLELAGHVELRPFVQVSHG